MSPKFFFIFSLKYRPKPNLKLGFGSKALSATKVIKIPSAVPNHIQPSPSSSEVIHGFFLKKNLLYNTELGNFYAWFADPISIYILFLEYNQLWENNLRILRTCAIYQKAIWVSLMNICLKMMKWAWENLLWMFLD